MIAKAKNFIKAKIKYMLKFYLPFEQKTIYILHNQDTVKKTLLTI